MLTPIFIVCEQKSVGFTIHGAVSQTSGANVLLGNRAFLVHHAHLLNIRIPMGGGFTIAVADGIPAHLTLSTNAANSRHISITSRNDSQY